MERVSERIIEGLRFVMTSPSYPEQYDVFFGDRQVGYVRLRWGFLAADVPEAGGETIFESEDEDEIGYGEFATAELRAIWLTRAAQAIRGRMTPDRLGGVG